MRTSGRGGSESLMFIAPAAIFGGFFIWMYGTPTDAVVALDRFLMKGIQWAVSFGAAVIQAVF